MYKPLSNFNKFELRVRKLQNNIGKLVEMLISSGEKTRFKYERHLVRFYNGFLKEVRCRGKQSAVGLYKDYKRIGTQICLGESFVFSARRKVVHGVPAVLIPLLELFKGNVTDKRIALTILGVVKLIRLKPDPSIQNIVGPSTATHLELVLGGFRDFIILDRRLSVRRYFSNWRHSLDPKSQLHENFKMGPNGPSLITPMTDLRGLGKHPLLYNSVSELLRITNPSAYSSLTKMWGALYLEESKSRHNSYPGKVGLIAQLCEGGGKTRNIALVDFWSQNALKWVHDEVFEILKKEPCDGTFDQDRAFILARDKALISGECYSFDLSAATDRFPLGIQSEVVRKVFGSEIEYHWTIMMKERSFSFHKANNVRWAVGQPLGCLSSWGVFTLSHHLFVRYCASDPNFDNYVILGDDIVICDAKVANAYQVRMKQIGVDINLSKSFVSPMSNPQPYGEFCKRIFLGKDEISGIPSDMLNEAFQSVYSMPILLEFISVRWFPLLAREEFGKRANNTLIKVLGPRGLKILGVALAFRSAIRGMSGLDCENSTASPAYPVGAVFPKNSAFVDAVLEEMANTQQKAAIREIYGSPVREYQRDFKTFLGSRKYAKELSTDMIGANRMFIHPFTDFIKRSFTGLVDKVRILDSLRNRLENLVNARSELYVPSLSLEKLASRPSKDSFNKRASSVSCRVVLEMSGYKSWSRFPLEGFDYDFLKSTRSDSWCWGHTHAQKMTIYRL